MRFTKQQRNMILKIASGSIWDIYSFVDNFQTRRVASFDWYQVQLNFQNDPDVSAYYCPRNLSPTPANLTRKDAFEEKVQLEQINPEMYEQFLPQLEKTYCHHIEEVCGSEFSFDFYQGVRIADSFEDIIDFLAIWQFLKEHALVLEVGQTLTAETVGLFFRHEEAGDAPPFEAEKASQTVVFCDSRYIGHDTYHLSTEHLEICREFLGKRIYPAPGLKLFVQNRFRTQDEVAQLKTLVTAWIAIFVALLVGLFPYFFQQHLRADDVTQSSGVTYQENDGITAANS